MTPGILLALTIVAILLTGFAATAAQVLHGFAKHELEEYCERRGNKSLFGRIIDEHEQMALGAETLRIIATTFGLAAAIGWFVETQNINEMSAGGWVAVVSLLTMVMLLANSWIPFAIAKVAAPQFLYHTWKIWWAVSLLVWPLMIGGNFVHELFQRASGVSEEDDDEEEALEDEIRSIVSEGERDGLLEADERDMIEGVIELDEKDVGSIMTPRSRVDALEVDTDWDEMLAFAVECGRTRIPIYQEKPDHVIGILYTKDLLKESLKSESKRKPLRKLLRDPIVVPESKLLDEMLAQFKNLRVHLAIVQDEYGGMAGVVTIEDILEEIVGEIVDETDNEQRAEIQVTSPGNAQVLGIASVAEVNEVLGLELPEDEDFDTISGLIMNELKEIPRKGRTIVIDNATFTIAKANRRAIEELTICVEEIAAGQNGKRNSA
jgi:CBS domain containing-hemolysin-like protein